MDELIEILEEVLMKLRDDSIYSNDEIVEIIRKLIDSLQED